MVSRVYVPREIGTLIGLFVRWDKGLAQKDDLLVLFKFYDP
jgi:hypothetical protein